MKSLKITLLSVLLSSSVSWANTLDIGWNLWTSTVSSQISTFFQSYPDIRVIWGYENGLWYGAAREISDQELLAPLYPQLDSISASQSYWIKVDSAVDMPVSTIGSAPTNPATSCKEILDSGASKGDGIYWLQLSGMGYPLRLSCDMSYQGGGWTVIDSMAFTRLVTYETILCNGSGYFSSSVNEGAGVLLSPDDFSGTNHSFTNIVELDLKVEFQEYVFSTSFLNIVDTLKFMEGAFLANDALSPTESPDYGFGSLGIESLQSIIGTTSTTDVLGAVAIGTNIKIHSLKMGGEFGDLKAKTVHLDTIQQEFLIETTPQTSRVRVKAFCQDCNTYTKRITFNEILIR
mgnify:CR=1 FL=1